MLRATPACVRAPPQVYSHGVGVTILSFPVSYQFAEYDFGDVGLFVITIFVSLFVWGISDCKMKDVVCTYMGLEAYGYLGIRTTRVFVVSQSARKTCHNLIQKGEVIK